MIGKYCGNCSFNNGGCCEDTAVTEPITVNTQACDGWEYDRNNDAASFTEYQQDVLRTVNPKLSETAALSMAALGLCGEAGEAGEIVKKHIEQGHEFNREKAIKELGDALFYLTWYAALIGSSLEEAAVQNIAKRKARYPDGFDKQRSINRTE
jgi:NTP pyrophosphatase (non-canonical NTP hydrolase)